METKPHIHEVLIVEGHHDSEHLHRFYDCATIETGGTSLDERTMEQIQEAARTRGIIVFTDPDAPGNAIRQRINDAIPGCKNAFVDKKNARTIHKVGVEHAPKRILEEALANIVTYDSSKAGSLTMEDMVDLGLAGGVESGQIREALGAKLHLGGATAKTMLKRLNFAGLTTEQLRKEIQDVKANRNCGTDQGNSEAV